jgi:hypothetical protein
MTEIRRELLVLLIAMVFVAALVSRPVNSLTVHSMSHGKKPHGQWREDWNNLLRVMRINSAGH